MTYFIYLTTIYLYLGIYLYIYEKFTYKITLLSVIFAIFLKVFKIPFILVDYLGIYIEH